MGRVLGLVLGLFLSGNAFAQLGTLLTTAIDVRTKAEVAHDLEIAADANKRLLKDKRAQWSGVTLLTFAQHVVLAGAVKTEEAKKLVEQVVRQDKRIRSFRNELLVGDTGSLVKDTALEVEINATLTATKGVHSVNMRWSSTGGHVVLMGVAQSGQEAGLAQQKIRGVKGVKKIVSHLRIAAAKK